MRELNLTKHHGLGNDFLVLLDLDGHQPVDEQLARALCDRHRGVGADGVMRVTPGRDGADVAMELRNADGSEAEMSGNGIRCLAQAVVDAGIVEGPELVVDTAAGSRRLVVQPTDRPSVLQVTVDMGVAKLVDVADGRATVDMGNPHLVLRVDEAGLGDLLAVGAQHPELNVELVVPGPGADEVTMRVHERGVGETLACGTGACAVAAVAHAWGVAGERVVVHQAGGDAVVELEGEAVRLTGPAERICKVVFPWH